MVSCGDPRSSSGSEGKEVIANAWFVDVGRAGKILIILEVSLADIG